MVAVSLLSVLVSATGCAKSEVPLGTDTISPDSASPAVEEDTTTTADAATSTAEATATT